MVDEAIKTNKRAPFLEDNSDEFSTKPRPTGLPDEELVIKEISKDNNFPSRQAQNKDEPVQPIKQQRRHRTGRNQQLNIKATDQTVQKFYRIADEANITLGEVLERALTALEAGNKKSEVEN